MKIIIRQAQKRDLPYLLELYEQLNKIKSVPICSESEEIFKNICGNSNQFLMVAEVNDKAVATVTITIIQSLTHSMRPYAVVEHLCVHEKSRNLGIATMLLAKVTEICRENNCYKIMLMTRQSDPIVHRLYSKAGFSSSELTAYEKTLYV